VPEFHGAAYHLQADVSGLMFSSFNRRDHATVHRGDHLVSRRADLKMLPIVAASCRRLVRLSGQSVRDRLNTVKFTNLKFTNGHKSESGVTTTR
jgi:hypothetical protein